MLIKLARSFFCPLPTKEMKYPAEEGWGKRHNFQFQSGVKDGPLRPIIARCLEILGLGFLPSKNVSLWHMPSLPEGGPSQEQWYAQGEKHGHPPPLVLRSKMHFCMIIYRSAQGEG